MEAIVKMRWFAIAILVYSVVYVSADYKCVCSYNIETKVYIKPSLQGDVIGDLYEFDCKPDAGQSDDNWLTVFYEHKIGYVENSEKLQVQTCAGSVPDGDKFVTGNNTSTMAPITTSTMAPITTSTMAPTTTSTMAPTTTSSMAPSTVVPTTTATFVAIPVKTNSVEITKSTDQTTTVTTEQIHSSTPTTTQQAPTTPLTEVTSTLQPAIILSTKPSTQNSNTSMSLLLTTIKSNSLTQTQTTTTKASSQMPPVTNIIQGHLELCSNRIQHAAKQDHAILAQFGESCYEFDHTTVSWSHAESICHQNGGHLAHIANQNEQDFIQNFMNKHHTHSSWIGFNDRNHEEHFEWTSGVAVTYTNWEPGRKQKNHDAQDCVFISPDSGLWDERACGGDHQHAYICQFATVTATTAAPQTLSLDGNLNLCSSSLQQHVAKDAGKLAQYDQSCYEIVPNTNKTWDQAENFCKSRGGHLAQISNAKEQSFIQEFMERYSPLHAVWIGLSDQHREGHFHWTSGDSAHYTHWLPSHHSDHHNKEDCVVLIPFKNGHWDDLPCGSTVTSHHHTQVVGEVHPVLCQYSTNAGPSLVG